MQYAKPARMRGGGWMRADGARDATGRARMRGAGIRLGTRGCGRRAGRTRAVRNANRICKDDRAA